VLARPGERYLAVQVCHMAGGDAWNELWILDRETGWFGRAIYDTWPNDDSPVRWESEDRLLFWRGNRAERRLELWRAYLQPAGARVRIPMKAATRSGRNRPAIPIESGHSAGFGAKRRCGVVHLVPATRPAGKSVVPVFPFVGKGLLRFRMDSPFRVMVWALWTSRSRMASARVGSPRYSCQLATGS